MSGRSEPERAWASAPVSTPCTPSSARAELASTLRMRAWACGLRTKAACSMPASFTSSRKRPCPVSRRGSSLRLSAVPVHWVWSECQSSMGDLTPQPPFPDREGGAGLASGVGVPVLERQARGEKQHECCAEHADSERNPRYQAYDEEHAYPLGCQNRD